MRRTYARLFFKPEDMKSKCNYNIDSGMARKLFVELELYEELYESLKEPRKFYEKKQNTDEIAFIIEEISTRKKRLWGMVYEKYPELKEKVVEMDIVGTIKIIK